MKCVRCKSDRIISVATAPESPDAWEIYLCQRCNFTWRNNEYETLRTVYAAAPEFRLSEKDFQGSCFDSSQIGN